MMTSTLRMDVDLLYRKLQPTPKMLPTSKGGITACNGLRPVHASVRPALHKRSFVGAEDISVASVRNASLLVCQVVCEWGVAITLPKQISLVLVSPRMELEVKFGRLPSLPPQPWSCFSMRFPAWLKLTARQELFPWTTIDSGSFSATPRCP